MRQIRLKAERLGNKIVHEGALGYFDVPDRRIQTVTGLHLGSGMPPLPWAILRPADPSEVRKRRRKPAPQVALSTHGKLGEVPHSSREGGAADMLEAGSLDTIPVQDNPALPGPDLLRRLRKLRTPEARPGNAIENGSGPGAVSLEMMTGCDGLCCGGLEDTALLEKAGTHRDPTYGILGVAQAAGLLAGLLQAEDAHAASAAEAAGALAKAPVWEGARAAATQEHELWFISFLHPAFDQKGFAERECGHGDMGVSAPTRARASFGCRLNFGSIMDARR